MIMAIKHWRATIDIEDEYISGTDEEYSAQTLAVELQRGMDNLPAGLRIKKFRIGLIEDKGNRGLTSGH